MKKLKFLFLLGAVFSLAACSSNVKSLRGATLLREPSKGNETNFYNDGYKQFKAKLKTFSNKFADKFISQKFVDGENITVSPLSLEMCLGLAICASNGTTRQEMLDAFGMDYNTFKAHYSTLYNEYNRSKDSNGGDLMFEIMMTNSIWIDDNIKLKDSGLDDLKDNYYCYSYETDFSGKKANEAIAKFIEIQSKGLLKPTLDIDLRTLFVLMNTLYLKDIWNETGNNLNFSDNPEHYFVNSDKSKSSKKLLDGYYFAGKAISNENYSAFHTSTENGFKIYFVKPNDGKEIKNVFTRETMDYVLNSENYVYRDDIKKEEYETQCFFPEFEADCDANLESILINDFSIKSLFDSKNCNFSNLTDEAVFCNEVKQIAKLDVNKKGIEGAAVTYMAVGTAAGPGEYTTVYEDFVVNKEFGFILTYSDSVVFSGVVTNIDK